jgi:hypothetical protein
MKTTTKNVSSSPALITVIVFLLGLVGYLSFSLKQLSDFQNNITDPTNQQFPTEDPPKENLSQKMENTTTFTHPTLRYSIDFPSAWNPKLFVSPAGRSIQPYRDLVLYSPDYDPQLFNESSLTQQKNASILVRVAETTYDNTEEKFNDNIAAQKIARDVQQVNVNGVPAIQYDYSFKDENATVITMVRDGKWYFIKFQYDNEEIKRKYMDTFKEVFNSLRIN